MTERILPEPEKNQVCAPADESILEFYKGYFDSVYVILHPFLKIANPDKIDFEKDDYPSKDEITNYCEKITWKRYLEFSGIEDIKTLDIALRNSIGGLKEKFKNDISTAKLDKTFDEHKIYHPSEGNFQKIILDSMLNGLIKLGHKWIYIGDEFGTERKLIFIEDVLSNKEVITDWYKNIFTPKNEILYTVHWDSHFTLLCSDRENIDSIVTEFDFEGFYCNQSTEIYWSVT